MTILVCSDLHHGVEGDPANDETPGWWNLWSLMSEPKLRLGDMDELWQFTREEIGELAGTDVAGNHDSEACSVKELRRGDTIFLHWDRFDPLIVKWVGRPVTWAVGKLERVWPDADVALAKWFQKKFKAGRHGNMQRYARMAAAYAKKRGATQIVGGHLHQRFTVTIDGIRVVCAGCCCNGNMDFVTVRVNE